MTSKSIVQASSEPNVELKSYISLDRSLHDAREIYESFASIVESSRPLPANFSGSLFYFQVQNRIAKFFINPRPRLVEPEDYFDTPLEWTDVLRESLALKVSSTREMIYTTAVSRENGSKLPRMIALKFCVAS
ncbi:hypothetical protein N7453_001259 [Penicillium expansum]|nr:hypothetical protein N7453_001259 [Penicillium expansum]